MNFSIYFILLLIWRTSSSEEGFIGQPSNTSSKYRLTLHFINFQIWRTTTGQRVWFRWPGSGRSGQVVFRTCHVNCLNVKFIEEVADDMAAMRTMLQCHMWRNMGRIRKEKRTWGKRSVIEKLPHQKVLIKCQAFDQLLQIISFLEMIFSNEMSK